MFFSIFYGKKYKCVWCGKNFYITYKPTRKDFVPLCDTSCAQSYFANMI